MEYSNLMSLVVLSCDDYSDQWDIFFSFKEKYWPDCPFKTYLVNDTIDYKREGVTVLNCGKVTKWSTRVRTAIEKITTPYVCPILDDHYIIERVDNQVIFSLLELSLKHGISYLALEPRSFIQHKSYREYLIPDIALVPRHQKYGINTSAAIWNREDYLNIIGPEEYSPWQFEINMCNLARTEQGLPGFNVVDVRNSLKICEYEVVRQGVYLSRALKHIKKMTGVDLDTSKRGVMPYWKEVIDVLNGKAARLKYGKSLIRKVAQLFGRKYFTEA